MMCPGPSPMRTAARTAVFIPGAGAPACITARRKRCLVRLRAGAAGRAAWCSGFEMLLESCRRAAPSRSRNHALRSLWRPARVFSHAFHQRSVGDAVAAQADQLRLVIGFAESSALDGRIAQQGAQVAVEGAGRAAALDMTQNGDTHFFAQALFQRFGDFGAADLVAVAVARAFGDDHDGIAPPGPPPGFQPLAHQLAPVVDIRRVFGDQHPVCAGCQPAHQRQVAAVAPHHLDHKGALVAGGGAADGVDRFGDAVQGRIGADGHIRAEHVIVDRADQPDDLQVGMVGGDFGADLTVLNQLCNQLRPFLAEEIRAGQAAIAADDHQAVKCPHLSRFLAALQAAFTGAKGVAAGGADDRSAALQDAADTNPRSSCGSGRRHPPCPGSLRRWRRLRSALQRCADDRAQRRHSSPAHRRRWLISRSLLSQYPLSMLAPEKLPDAA